MKSQCKAAILEVYQKAEIPRLDQFRDLLHPLHLEVGAFGELVQRAKVGAESVSAILLGDSKHCRFEISERKTLVASSGLCSLLAVIVLGDLTPRVEDRDWGLPHAKGGRSHKFKRERLRPQEPFIGVVRGRSLDGVAVVEQSLDLACDGFPFRVGYPKWCGAP